MNRDYTPDDFRKDAGISPATLDKFRTYERLLNEWNKSINLVAESTLANIWQRHFMDSAQLFLLIPKEAKTLADMGSGAGFPGLVLAIMATELRPDLKISLIERDIRKAAFIRTVAGELKLKVDIRNIPVANVDARFDVITARALSELNELLALASAICQPSTIMLFLKGKTIDRELREAQKLWKFDARQMASCTDESGTVLWVSRLAKMGSGI